MFSKQHHYPSCMRKMKSSSYLVLFVKNRRGWGIWKMKESLIIVLVITVYWTKTINTISNLTYFHKNNKLYIIQVYEANVRRGLKMININMCKILQIWTFQRFCTFSWVKGFWFARCVCSVRIRNPWPGKMA